MRYNEFQINEDQLRKIARERYPHLTEEQLDEILPAIGAVAGRIGMAAAKMGAKAVGAGVKAAGRVGKQMGQAAAKAAGKGLKSAGQKLAQKAAGAIQQKAMQKMATQVLKPGAKLPMPGQDGKDTEFEVDGVKGDEVTLKNPQPKPGEPIKTVHNKKDLDPIIQQMGGAQ